MTAPALTEFLTARADGLEILARDMQHQAALGRPLVTLNGGGDLLRALVDPARVLAQVKAMRAIVEAFPQGPESIDVWDEAGWVILTALATPFADHPDYDPAWRLDA